MHVYNYTVLVYTGIIIQKLGIKYSCIYSILYFIIDIILIIIPTYYMMFHMDMPYIVANVYALIKSNKSELRCCRIQICCQLWEWRARHGARECPSHLIIRFPCVAGRLDHACGADRGGLALRWCGALALHWFAFLLRRASTHTPGRLTRCSHLPGHLTMWHTATL